jgi:Cu(I)/Ag(I) efflux system membrane fusion protein
MSISRVLRFIPSKLTVVFALLIALALGYSMRGCTDAPPAHEHAAPAADGVEAAEVWTCSMHPQIQQPDTGQCPICGMDLIPLEEDAGADPDAPVFKTTEAAAALMNLQTAPVERRFVEAAVRMVGSVTYDETRLASITAWAPGRIDRMFVDYTGIRVNEGDHMVELYSPELLVAQEELRRTVRALEQLRPNAPEVLRETAQTTAEAAREKLRRWGLTAEQIDRAESEGVVSDYVTIYSPISGTVIERHGQEGMYVDIGTKIYAVADMSVMWVELDAYESDLEWLRYGQTVEFTTKAWPGETFEGTISFIAPFLDERTRTVDVRVVVPNPDRRLKEDMFVRAVVRARVAEGGQVVDPSLEGKWISPMHPEIVKDAPGACDVCGMPLVKASELGYSVVEETEPPLIIPESAPLVTGKRAVVYVEAADAEAPTFEGREVVLGPKAGAFYIVREGLREGERVVVNGNFKIDSALQIQARPSMMAADAVEADADAQADDAAKSAATLSFDAPAAFRSELMEVYEAYLQTTEALANDDAEAALEGAKGLQAALAAMTADLEGEARYAWERQQERLAAAADAMADAEDIEAMRSAYQPVSNTLIQAVEAYGLPEGTEAYVVHCPMAFDFEGADWIDDEERVLNPYFGASMLRCGNVVRSLTAGEAS